MKKQNVLTAGIFKENPVFVLALGLCSALAISNSLDNALGMGIAMTVVLILSNTIISLLRKVTPNEVRIPVFIVVIATIVKSVEMLMAAYATDLSSSLGVFIPLITVNCIVLGRAEAFAKDNSVSLSLMDAIGMGIGYTIALVLVAVCREVLSTGALVLSNPFTNSEIFKLSLFSENFKIALFGTPAGAFLVFALVIAASNFLMNSRKEGK